MKKMLKEPLLHFAVAGVRPVRRLFVAQRQACRSQRGRTGAHRRRRRALAEADLVEPVAARAERRRVEGPGRRSPEREADGARGRGDRPRAGRHDHPSPPGAEAEIPGRGHGSSWPSRARRNCGSSMLPIQPFRDSGKALVQADLLQPRTSRRRRGGRHGALAAFNAKAETTAPTLATGCCSATASTTPTNWRCRGCSVRILRMRSSRSNPARGAVR